MRQDGFRCWRAPNMCELQNFTCEHNGTCVTEVDKAYCSCDEGFGGSHCEVSKSGLFWQEYSKIYFLTPPVTSDLILTTTETSVMIGKAVLLFHFPRAVIDPQESYQEFRTIFLMFAGYLFLFLHHPAILVLGFWKCTLAWYSTAVFFSLAVLTYLLEAINANETIRGKQRNIWAFDISGKSTLYFGQIYRLACSFAVVGGIVVAIGYGSSTQLVSSWTCMGVYSATSSDLWLPLLCLNFVTALSASAYSYESIFIQRNLPQYGERIEKYVEQLDDRRRNDILKCQRSIYFTCIGPWLLGALWLLQTVSCYLVTNVYVNGLMLMFSCLRSLCSILHSAFTAPTMYSKLVWLAMRMLPDRMSPVFDPMTMWTREEVLEKYERKTKKESMSSHKKGEFTCREECYPWNPAFEHYLPIYERACIRRQWTRSYVRLRMHNEFGEKAAVIWAVFVDDLEKHALHEQNNYTLDQTRWLFKCWIIRICRADPQEDSSPQQRSWTEEGLERHLWIYYEMLDKLSIPRPYMLRESAQKSEYYKSMENYLRMGERCDLFRMCMLTTVDRSQNTKQVLFLRAALKDIDPEVLDHLKATAGRNHTNTDEGHRITGEEAYLSNWMLTTVEKTEEELRGYRDRVWEIAILNRDYIQRSKAL
ncbi:hypothetical protein Aduo_017326 [Ancylostoma duodenale]